MIHNHCPDNSATAAPLPDTLGSADRFLLQIIGHAAITSADAKVLWSKLAGGNSALGVSRFEEVLFGLLKRRLLEIGADQKLCVTDAGVAALATR